MIKQIGSITINTNRWVDFNTVKYRSDWQTLCRYLGIQLHQVSKHQYRAKSPFNPGNNDTCLSLCTGEKSKGLFYDFKTGVGGNIIQFTRRMITELEDDHEAALFLEQLCNFTAEIYYGDSYRTNILPKKETPSQPKPINKPLQFNLKDLDNAHPFITETKRITPDTAKDFGMGYCKSGIMKDRIAIPIHNIEGEIVAYMGRAVNEEQAKAQGKYKFPYGFHKSNEVFNLHRCLESELFDDIQIQGLIIVEGVFDLMRLYQAGIKNVVSLMGTSVSQVQLEKLKAVSQTFLVFADNDEAGKSLGSKLELYLRDNTVKVFRYPKAHQDKTSPQDFNDQELKQIIAEWAQ